jgi:ribonuclease T2
MKFQNDVLVIGSVLLGLAAESVRALGVSATCSNPQTSCRNTTVVEDLCCFNAPGGSV